MVFKNLFSFQRPSWTRKTWQGWRPVILRGAILAFVVFIFNLVLTIAALVKPKSLSNGHRKIFEGDCNKVKQLDIGLHLVINVLSTILLGASNYAMQCLSAPTRREVDKAHEKRVWLDIGVLSFRNLTKIRKKRAFLWAFLGLSSMPLHLL
jgi:hypothetical protein